MSSKDNLGDRMKTYENVARFHLVRRMPVIIRIDGKAFHTFTRGFQKPFDPVLMQTMQDTMKYLCENIQGCVLGYTQSDEISLLVVDYQTLTTDSWFGNTVQKMCSVSASMATMTFNNYFRINTIKWDYDNVTDFNNKNNEIQLNLSKQANIYYSCFNNAMFDSRVFNVPEEDVINYFYWRQQDAIRNSIQSVGQANFSHKQLMNKSCEQIQDMLFREKRINWNDYNTSCKRGTCCYKQMMEVECKNESNKTIMRKKWIIDQEIPIFIKDMSYINNIVTVGLLGMQHTKLEELKRENTAFKAYKTYYDKLYGQGYEVANYHLNGDLEPLDNFIDDAEAEYNMSLESGDNCG